MKRFLRKAAVASIPFAIVIMVARGSQAEDLASFAVLAGSAITNTGATVINGNVGISPGTAVTGFPPGIINAPFALHQTDGVASLAQSDLTTAYNVLAGRPATADLTGRDLAGQTLTAGVYNFNTASQLTGTVTLDGQGNPNATFIFNIGSTLTTGSGSSVALINGAKGANVFFRVGSSATLGAATAFAGQIYALTSITLVTGANIACGAALARNGAVTLDTNTISICPMTISATGPTTTAPPPTTAPPATTAPPTTTTAPPTTTASPTAVPTTTTTVPAAAAIIAAGGGTTTGAIAVATAAAAAAAIPAAAAPPGTTGGTVAATAVPPVFVTAVGPFASGNDRSVANAIDQSVGSGNVVPLTFQVIRSVLPAPELASAFKQISGEAATGIAPGGIQAMHSFLSVIFDSAFDDHGPISEEAPAENNHRSTVRALGYAEEDHTAAQSPFGGLDRGHGLRPLLPQAWTIWAGGFGGQTSASGDAAHGSHERSSDSYGYAIGADYRATSDTRLGFALAGGHNTYSLSDGLGGGGGDMAQAAVYTRTNFGPAYVMAAVAGAYHDVSTSRQVTIGGVSDLRGSFSASDFAGEIEAGYRLRWFIPYGAFGVQSFHTPSYSEKTVGPLPSIFGLSYNDDTTVTTRTQLGFRIDQDVAVFDDGELRFRARAAWAHDSSTDALAKVSFQALPGSFFPIYGASRAGDSFLFAAGPELRFRNGLSLAATFDGQVSRGYQSYYGTGQVRYVW